MCARATSRAATSCPSGSGPRRRRRRYPCPDGRTRGQRPPVVGPLRKENTMRRLETVVASLFALLAFVGPAGAQGTLRIGMTASDIPYSGGPPDNGFEGFRF